MHTVSASSKRSVMYALRKEGHEEDLIKLGIPNPKYIEQKESLLQDMTQTRVNK